MSTPTASFYYHYDDLGSTINLTNATGAKQWTETYEPYGSIKTETNNSGTAPTNLMKFAGEQLDATGLYHLRARQYDPGTGRFTGADPIGAIPQAGASEATYIYASDAPTAMVDPSGLEGESSNSSSPYASSRFIQGVHWNGLTGAAACRLTCFASPTQRSVRVGLRDRVCVWGCVIILVGGQLHEEPGVTPDNPHAPERPNVEEPVRDPQPRGGRGGGGKKGGGGGKGAVRAHLGAGNPMLVA